MENYLKVVEKDNKTIEALEIREAVKWLRAEGRKEYKDGTYHSWIAPEIEADLMSTPTITSIYQYSQLRSGSSNPLISGHVPSVYGVKFFRTKKLPAFRAGDYLLVIKSSFDKKEYVSIFRGK